MYTHPCTCRLLLRGRRPSSPLENAPKSPSSVLELACTTAADDQRLRSTGFRVLKGPEYDVYDMPRAKPPASAPLPPTSALADLIARGASFASLTMLTAAVKAVEESDDRPELLRDSTSGVYLLRGGGSSSGRLAASRRHHEPLGSGQQAALAQPRTERPHRAQRELRFCRAGGAVDRFRVSLDRGLGGDVPRVVRPQRLVRRSKLRLLPRNGGDCREPVQSLRRCVEGKSETGVTVGIPSAGWVHNGESLL